MEIRTTTTQVKGLIESMMIVWKIMTSEQQSRYINEWLHI